MLRYNRQIGHGNIGTKNKVEEMFHFKKHVDANHGLIVKTFGKEMNNNLKSPFEKQFTKKGL
jgi:hypothetical protein